MGVSSLAGITSDPLSEYTRIMALFHFFRYQILTLIKSSIEFTKTHVRIYTHTHSTSLLKPLLT